MVQSTSEEEATMAQPEDLTEDEEEDEEEEEAVVISKKRLTLSTLSHHLKGGHASLKRSMTLPKNPFTSGLHSHPPSVEEDDKNGAKKPKSSKAVKLKIGNRQQDDATRRTCQSSRTSK